jgi:hypothetical protein
MSVSDADPAPPFGFPLPPAEPPPPRRSHRRLWLSLLALGLAVVLIAASYTVVRYLIDNSRYRSGHDAYQHADCAVAVNHFDDVLSAWRIVQVGGTVGRAESEKAECLVFEEAVKKHDSGNASGALVAYTTFIPRRPPSPLVDAARARVAELLKQRPPADLATVETCETLPTLRELKLLDPTLAPAFLAACGNAYAHANEREKARAVYSRLFQEFSTDKVSAETEAQLLKDDSWCPWLSDLRNDLTFAALKDLIPGLLVTCAKAPTALPRDAILYTRDFLKQFPGHRFAPDALATLAAMINKAARTDPSAHDFGQEHPDGTIGGPKAVIMLYNDSPEKLGIALSGPEPRVEDVDPCPNCPVNPPGSTNNICRKAATLKRIVITPGEYDMALDFTDSKTNGGYAHWTLQPGKQYFACYSISEANH